MTSASAVSRRSEEVCLLHDTKEFLLIHLSVAVAVSLVDHFLQLLVGHALTKLLGNTLEVLESDLAGLIIVEKTEGLQNLILRVAIEDLVSHHLQEFFVADGATSIVIHVRNHLLNLLLLRLEAKGSHGNLQLLGVDLPRAIR